MKLVSQYRLTAKFAGMRGTILLLTLVFMLMLAIISTTVMQTAIMNVHMAGNDQFLEEALNTAEGIATELSLNRENFLLEAQVGQSNCVQASSNPDCDFKKLPLTGHAGSAQDTDLDYRVTREEPYLYAGFPIRESQAVASSSDGAAAALFEISVRVDGTPRKLASVHVVQGMAVRVPVTRR